MKKVVIFVEGETEFDFVSRFIVEISKQNQISVSINVVDLSENNTTRSAILVGNSEDAQEVFSVTLNVSGSDNRVTADISKNAETLIARGFQHVIGLKDLKGDKNERPITLIDLPSIEIADAFVETQCQPMRAKIVTAVMEIETWFIAETSHYQRRLNKLTEDFVRANIQKLGFNPYNEEVDSLTKITDPKAALNRLYKLAGRGYSTRRNVRTKTINALDYTNLYLNTRQRLTQLNMFVNELDEFLSISTT